MRTKSKILVLILCAMVAQGCRGFQTKVHEALTGDNGSSNTTHSQTAPSQTVPSGIAIPAISEGDIILERMAYTTCYDAENRIPRWVAWSLTAEHARGTQKRESNFSEDSDVEYPRAQPSDYKRSGYDRGHMCPAGDNKWNGKAMRETFLLTNICPQDHNLNCGDWGELENLCRDWAQRYGEVHIVCGPILYGGSHRTIGQNQVTVPEAFFKVVLCMNPTPRAIGFIYKNQPGNRPKSSYVNTVDQVERITGLDFFPALPDDIESRIEAKGSLSEW